MLFLNAACEPGSVFYFSVIANGYELNCEITCCNTSLKPA